MVQNYVCYIIIMDWYNYYVPTLKLWGNIIIMYHEKITYFCRLHPFVPFGILVVSILPSGCLLFLVETC